MKTSTHYFERANRLKRLCLIGNLSKAKLGGQTALFPTRIGRWELSLNGGISEIEATQIFEAVKNMVHWDPGWLWELRNIKHEVITCLLQTILGFKEQLALNLNKRFGNNMQTLLHIAASDKNHELYTLLKEADADENIPDEQGVIPLTLLNQSSQTCGQ